MISAALPAYALWAIVGHLANGASFLIDKSLLRQSFKRPATYAGLVGLLGTLCVFFLPFIGHASYGAILLSLCSGAAFVLALLAFFAALAAGETSRVVPIVGSLIPILTLFGTWTFLGERLHGLQPLGFFLLIVATAILSGGSKGHRISRPAIAFAVCAAIAFAVSSVTGKASYNAAGFFTAFVYARLFGAVTAALIIFSDRSAFSEIRTIFFPDASRQKRKASRAKTASILILVGQSLGALGFVFVQYAISTGSAALVNALQAVQYAFLVLAGFIAFRIAPRLLGEDLSRGAVIRKSLAIICVAFGLWYIV